MALASSICLSLSPPSKTLAPPSTSTTRGCRCCFVVSVSNCRRPARRKRQQVVFMAPEEEKLTRRNPLDFPISTEFQKKKLCSNTQLDRTWLFELLSLLNPRILTPPVNSEWERPKPGRRPDIFPQFSPMKTPLPPPMPYDPPEEDEEEEEKKEEEEEDPEKEEEPEKQS